jgi:hypothetical protein
MKDKREVIKHSAAIHIQNNITLLQRRAWNVLLALAYDQLLTEEEHRVKIAVIMRMLEFESKNEDYLKEALEALISCKLKWNILHKDHEQEWGVTALLAQAKIKGGICTYAYSPELRRRLHNPSMYARISLSMQNKFESKHAQALWELCVDCLDDSKNYGETRFIPLAVYRELMGIAESMYPEFKKLNEWVIKVSVQEINRVTDFQVAVDYQRESRKVTALKFKVRRVAHLPGLRTEQGALFPDVMDMPLAVRELKDAGMATDEAWKIWQEGFNCVEAEKRPTDLKGNPETAFDSYVHEKVHLLKRQQQLGKVKNITGFLRTAIKKNYANPEFVIEKNKQTVREHTKARQISERKQQLSQQQRSVVQARRDKELHELCEQIVKDTPTLLQQLTTGLFKENAILKKSYQPEKCLIENYQEKPMLRVMVDQYLMDHYPERFCAIRERYDAQLAALESKPAAEERASV